MKDLHRWLFPSWLLVYLTICKCSNIIVQNFEGENTTLPCKYDIQYHGKCHICWIRGDIPNMGCGDEIIGSDGDTTVNRQSQRYQITGEIRHGDVSLTILNITKQDSGKYGCRIHVPGLFNDEMHYVHLIVSDAPTPATWETTSITSSFYESETSGVFATAMTEGKCICSYCACSSVTVDFHSHCCPFDMEAKEEKQSICRNSPELRELCHLQ
ncbi:T-cell immunoglobulin and mucin domain-containing protein 4-like isoform X2 [Xyrauchen texanus]|uniref:T-cell immunoglobulin and mucin domain-containing protein 4-like isoform X2 n=1 Tax=Xyrauchen texanus TaxID=154827 RepID=UPI002242A39C|nr:T-cell immunoglobulin and mucin domain-containing protein 4-like isoform X2 [Xyrauchen texanus]